MPKLKPVKIIIAGEDRFSKKFNQQFKTIKSFGNKVNSIGKSMSLGVTVPMVLAGKAMISTASTFEASMNKVEALTGSTGDELAQMSNLAKDLGISTKFSAGEAADAMSFLGMAGFEANEILAATPPLLDLAAVSQLDLARAADITSNIMGAYAIEAENMTGVTDILAAVTSSANVDMEMLAETLRYAGPIAKKFGASLEDTAAAAGFLGNIGIQGSMAGTALRTMFVNLAAPTSAAGQALKAIGIDVETTDGKMRDFKEILSGLATALPKLSDAKQIQILKDVFGKRAISAAAGLVDNISSGKRGFLQLAKSLQNVTGKAKTMAEIMNRGAIGSFKRLKASLEGLSIAMGDTGALGVITRLLDRTAQFFRTLSKSNPLLLKAIMIFGILLTVLGPLLTMIGAITAGLAGMMIVIGAAGGLLAVLTSPIALVVGALAALGIGIAAVSVVSSEMGDETETMEEKLNRLTTNLTQKPGLIIGSWNKLTPFFKLLNNEIEKSFVTFGNFGKFLGESFDLVYARHIQPILNGMESIIDGMTRVLAFFARISSTHAELQAAGLNQYGMPILEDTAGETRDQMRSGLLSPGRQQESVTKIVFENLPESAKVIYAEGNADIEFNRGPLLGGYAF